jgi:hypothetical protein
MSFDLILIHMQDGDEADADRARVLAVLDAYPDRSGNADSYDVSFEDGSHVEFRASGLTSGEKFTSCSFTMRSYSYPMAKFVYAIALAGDFSIINCQGKDAVECPFAIIINEAQRAHLWEDPGEHIGLANSAVELATLLWGSAEQWQQYRNQVLGSE